MHGKAVPHHKGRLNHAMSTRNLFPPCEVESCCGTSEEVKPEHAHHVHTHRAGKDEKESLSEGETEEEDCCFHVEESVRIFREVGKDYFTHSPAMIRKPISTSE